MLQTHAIRFKSDMSGELNDGNILPPLSNLGTPDRSRRLDSQADQFIIDSDFK